MQAAAAEGLVFELYLYSLFSLQRTKTEQPTFPEPMPTSHQRSHTPPHTNRAGHPAQARQNWETKEPPEPRPTISTTRGTWTS